MYQERPVEQCQFSILTGPIIPTKTEICKTNFSTLCNSSECNSCDRNFCFFERLQMNTEVTDEDPFTPPGEPQTYPLFWKRVVRVPQTKVNTSN